MLFLLLLKIVGAINEWGRKVMRQCVMKIGCNAFVWQKLKLIGFNLSLAPSQSVPSLGGWVVCVCRREDLNEIIMVNSTHEKFVNNTGLKFITIIFHHTKHTKPLIFLSAFSFLSFATFILGWMRNITTWRWIKSLCWRFSGFLMKILLKCL